MTDTKFHKVVYLRERTEALRAYEAHQKKNCREKLKDALDMTREHVMATQRMSPKNIDVLVKFADSYIDKLRDAVIAKGGTGVEITATFPGGKVTIDKFSR